MPFSECNERLSFFVILCHLYRRYQKQYLAQKGEPPPKRKSHLALAGIENDTLQNIGKKIVVEPHKANLCKQGNAGEIFG